ncbi:MAG: SDR family oxidoreductase [Ignavibacteriae bacterium]|nr:SDR family oxidoreductase [Ignavibacteriota bacterium]
MGFQRVLVTGATGFLGWNCARAFSARGLVVSATYNAAPPPEAPWRWLPLDLATSPTIRFQDYDAVIHCAAMSSVHSCHAQPALAMRVNRDGTRALAEAAAANGTAFVYISTDLVFDGRDGWYTENDVPQPPSVYAQSKYEGEAAALESGGRVIVLRTALMYGPSRNGPGGFLSWTLPALHARDELRLYANQFRTPLYAPDVPALLVPLLERVENAGIYHAAGPDRLSREEMGRIISEEANISDPRITSTVYVRGVDAYPIDDTSLRTEKVRLATGFPFTDFRTGIRDTMRDAQPVHSSHRTA